MSWASDLPDGCLLSGNVLMNARAECPPRGLGLPHQPRPQVEVEPLQGWHSEDGTLVQAKCIVHV